MHPNVFKQVEYFVKNFISKEDNLKILDIGSLQLPRSSNKDELQPSLKQTFDGDKWKYIGCDMVEGPNVDVVVKDTDSYPFDSCSFDVVVSNNCLEHDPKFWVTFNEMERLLKSSGYLFLMVPQLFETHRYPVDCWRFQSEDAMQALADWNKRVTLEEGYVSEWFKGAYAADCIGIFKKL